MNLQGRLVLIIAGPMSGRVATVEERFKVSGVLALTCGQCGKLVSETAYFVRAVTGRREVDAFCACSLMLLDAHEPTTDDRIIAAAMRMGSRGVLKRRRGPHD